MEKEEDYLNTDSDQTKKRVDTIIDFISGQVVKASPEEIEATQIFSRKLVEDFEYAEEVVSYKRKI